MRKIKYTLMLLVVPILLCSCAKKEVVKQNLDISEVSWPIFRGDSALSGIAEDRVPDKLSLLWSFNTESYIISSPVIGSESVYIGSTDGKIYSLDLITGREVWTFDTEDDIEASPLLLDDAVYIGNLSGEFFCLDALSGLELWRYKCGSSIYGSANFVRDSSGQNAKILVGSYDNRMYCFDAVAGELLWVYETDNFINGAPSTDGIHVVFGGCDEILHIISVSDGQKAGEVWAGSYIPGSAAIVDNQAYLGHYDNQLVAIDLVEEEVIWTYEDREHPGPFFSSPAVTKDRVVIGSRDGYMHCVDRKTGEKIWDFQTFDEIDGSPVIAGDKVIFGSIDGRLYIVNLKNGEKIWSYEIGAALIGCPAVAGGFIVIGSEDGRVYMFGEKL
ncbi:PQQ-binding-like beta-propeller repeat protein [Acidobacteriota bacterium]